MNPIYSSLPRQTETHRCCGIIYRRWRFVGKRFNQKRPIRCRECGERIAWRQNYNAYRINHPPEKNRLEKYHDQAITFKLMGLTTTGKSRVRPFALPISREERNRRMMARYYARRDRLAAKGLTTRGTKRKLFPKQLPPLEVAWKSLRAEIKLSPIGNWDDIESSINR